MRHACEEELKRRWLALCSRHLPLIKGGDSIWRFSREREPCEPAQGWKLHVSATVLNAPDVLARIAPVLRGLGVRFKAPSTLQEVMTLNAGLSYGYSQVGKVFTAYSRTDEEAVRLARRLHTLTRHLPAPAVPFDLQFRPGSNVFYRYGAMDSLHLELPDGSRVQAIRDPNGNPVPDLRESAEAKPEWIENPFPQHRAGPPRDEDSPLGTTLRVIHAVAQRGKGGVYKAVDLSAGTPRLCLLKEGRKNGEVAWDGRDGRWRVANEERALKALRARGVEVARAYSSFELEGDRYLATEYIEGETLHAFLGRRQRRLSIRRVILYGIEVATLLAKIHAAGWAWRDCKPSNLLVTRGGALRPVDFEGACLIDEPDPLPWVTPAFSRPKVPIARRAGSAVIDDLYALGVVLYLLLTGVMPEAPPAFTRARALRPGVPERLCGIVSELLSPEPREGGEARRVARRLRAVLPRVYTG